MTVQIGDASSTKNNDYDIKKLEQNASSVVLAVQKCVEILRTIPEFTALKPSALWSALKESSKATATGPNMEAWRVPESVRMEIEQQLLPVLPKDAHCGRSR